MATRTSVNFLLDLLLLLVMISLAATGAVIHFVFPPGTGCSYRLFGIGRHDLGQIHFYLATTAAVLVALHVVLHWKWICSVVGKAFCITTPSGRA